MTRPIAHEVDFVLLSTKKKCRMNIYCIIYIIYSPLLMYCGFLYCCVQLLQDSLSTDSFYIEVSRPDPQAILVFLNINSISL